MSTKDSTRILDGTDKWLADVDICFVAGATADSVGATAFGRADGIGRSRGDIEAGNQVVVGESAVVCLHLIDDDQTLVGGREIRSRSSESGDCCHEDDRYGSCDFEIHIACFESLGRVRWYAEDLKGDNMINSRSYSERKSTYIVYYQLYRAQL